MKRLESELEKKCILHARKSGWDCWKNEKNGNKGIPDYSMLKDGIFMLIEFKRDSKSKRSPEQVVWAKKHPRNVWVVSSFDDFKVIIEAVEDVNVKRWMIQL